MWQLGTKVLVASCLALRFDDTKERLHETQFNGGYRNGNIYAWRIKPQLGCKSAGWQRFDGQSWHK